MSESWQHQVQLQRDPCHFIPFCFYGVLHLIINSMVISAGEQSAVHLFKVVQLDWMGRGWQTKSFTAASNYLLAEYQHPPLLWVCLGSDLWLSYWRIPLDLCGPACFSALLRTLKGTGPVSVSHTYVFSHSGPIQAGAEKVGICGSVSGRLGTLGRGTLARLLVSDLPGQSISEVMDGRKGKC